MYLEYLNDVVAPYVRKHGGGQHGTEGAAFFYDIAKHHKTPKVLRWLQHPAAPFGVQLILVLRLKHNSQ